MSRLPLRVPALSSPSQSRPRSPLAHLTHLRPLRPLTQGGQDAGRADLTISAPSHSPGPCSSRPGPKPPPLSACPAAASTPSLPPPAETPGGRGAGPRLPQTSLHQHLATVSTAVQLPEMPAPPLPHARRPAGTAFRGMSGVAPRIPGQLSEGVPTTCEQGQMFLLGGQHRPRPPPGWSPPTQPGPPGHPPSRPPANQQPGARPTSHRPGLFSREARPKGRAPLSSWSRAGMWVQKAHYPQGASGH